jgi:glycosyltransferase involved in cell wall biosynthesis
MKNKFRYIEKNKRKKILLLCDDIRMNSGIGTMGKEIVLGTAHHFNWINLGAALKHPEEGKAFDLSENVNKEVGIDDSFIRIIPSTGYGNAQKVRDIIKVENPDALLIFTDPRYWTWLFEIEREIRSKIPIFWLNIWDDYPAPLYNRPYYESVDVLMAISKQTKNINEIVLDEKANDKLIKYVPHGINTKHFFPIKDDHEDYDKLVEFKKKVLKDKDYDFVLFFNSRNIARKHPTDTILAYRHFCDIIGKEKASKCAFILHTEPVDNNGTDLKTVREAFCDPNYVNVFFSTDKLVTAQMNLMYNIADATILLSSNEGWGLALTESLMTGTPIIANVTGGMQDQMRFVDENGEWINFTPDFPSNHKGTYKEHGEWAIPVFPSNISAQGSVPTPYIFDDRCSIEEAAEAIHKMYMKGDKERIRIGKLGYDWVTGDEANMTAEKMCNNVIETLDDSFKRFKPRTSFNFYKIDDRPKKYIKHKLTGY